MQTPVLIAMQSLQVHWLLAQLTLKIVFLLIRNNCDLVHVISLMSVPPLGKNGLKPSKQWLKAYRSKRRRWWTPLQTPWTWRSAWPKSNIKWYDPFTLYCESPSPFIRPQCLLPHAFYSTSRIPPHSEFMLYFHVDPALLYLHLHHFIALHSHSVLSQHQPWVA